MRDLAILFIHLLTTIAKLMRPGSGGAVVAESLLLKHQLLVLNRGRERAPNLRPIDRVIAGLCTIFIRPYRLLHVAVVLRPSTLLAFHAALVKRKYRVLFSPIRRNKPGPKRTFSGAYRGHCRDQETQSKLGLPANCTTTLSCV